MDRKPAAQLLLFYTQLLSHQWPEQLSQIIGFSLFAIIPSTHYSTVFLRSLPYQSVTISRRRRSNSTGMNDLKVHVRHCLLYEYQQGHTAADATRNICACVAQDAVSHSTAKYWFQRFREGDFSLEDRARSGRPSTLDIQRLHTLINSDPTQTTRNLAEQLDTSHSTVERHLHEQGKLLT